MTARAGEYVVWSNQLQAWEAGKDGYTSHFSEASRYSRDRALAICLAAIAPGLRNTPYALPLPEVPVLAADIDALQAAIAGQWTPNPDT